eukprot:3114941-Rhodomonas_salina.1
MRYAVLTQLIPCYTSAMRCPVLTLLIPRYAFAPRCPVLTAVCCYQFSLQIGAETVVAQVDGRLGTPPPLASQKVGYLASIVLRLCYAKPGTDVPYGATRPGQHSGVRGVHRQCVPAAHWCAASWAWAIILLLLLLLIIIEIRVDVVADSISTS